MIFFEENNNQIQYLLLQQSSLPHLQHIIANASLSQENSLNEIFKIAYHKNFFKQNNNILTDNVHAIFFKFLLDINKISDLYTKTDFIGRPLKFPKLVTFYRLAANHFAFPPLSSDSWVTLLQKKPNDAIIINNLDFNPALSDVSNINLALDIIFLQAEVCFLTRFIIQVSNFKARAFSILESHCLYFKLTLHYYEINMFDKEQSLVSQQNFFNKKPYIILFDEFKEMWKNLNFILTNQIFSLKNISQLVPINLNNIAYKEKIINSSSKQQLDKILFDISLTIEDLQQQKSLTNKKLDDIFENLEKSLIEFRLEYFKQLEEAKNNLKVSQTKAQTDLTVNLEENEQNEEDEEFIRQIQELPRLNFTNYLTTFPPIQYLLDILKFKNKSDFRMLIYQSNYFRVSQNSTDLMKYEKECQQILKMLHDLSKRKKKNWKFLEKTYVNYKKINPDNILNFNRKRPLIWFPNNDIVPNTLFSYMKDNSQFFYIPEPKGGLIELSFSQFLYCCKFAYHLYYYQQKVDEYMLKKKKNPHPTEIQIIPPIYPPKYDSIIGYYLTLDFADRTFILSFTRIYSTYLKLSQKFKYVSFDMLLKEILKDFFSNLLGKYEFNIDNSNWDFTLEYLHYPDSNIYDLIKHGFPWYAKNPKFAEMFDEVSFDFIYMQGLKNPFLDIYVKARDNKSRLKFYREKFVNAVNWEPYNSLIALIKESSPYYLEPTDLQACRNRVLGITLADVPIYKPYLPCIDSAIKMPHFLNFFLEQEILRLEGMFVLDLLAKAEQQRMQARKNLTVVEAAAFMLETFKQEIELPLEQRIEIDVWRKQEDEFREKGNFNNRMNFTHQEIDFMWSRIFSTWEEAKFTKEFKKLCDEDEVSSIVFDDDLDEDDVEEEVLKKYGKDYYVLNYRDIDFQLGSSLSKLNSQNTQKPEKKLDLSKRRDVKSSQKQLNSSPDAKSDDKENQEESNDNSAQSPFFLDKDEPVGILDYLYDNLKKTRKQKYIERVLYLDFKILVNHTKKIQEATVSTAKLTNTVNAPNIEVSKELNSTSINDDLLTSEPVEFSDSIYNAIDNFEEIFLILDMFGV
jgi:hypothetical protein